jgi:hypothetical protein
MSEKYIFNAEEKRDLIYHLRNRLVEVKADPSAFALGYAVKLERMISAYENHPDAQIIVAEVL